MKSSTEDLSAVMREISEKLDGILGFMAVRELKGDASLIVPKLKALGMSTKTIAIRHFMKELEPSRNVLCHMNPLSSTNARDLETKLERWEALVAGSPIPAAG